VTLELAVAVFAMYGCRPNQLVITAPANGVTHAISV
jgi:hypothetical protein